MGHVITVENSGSKRHVHGARGGDWRTSTHTLRETHDQLDDAIASAAFANVIPSLKIRSTRSMRWQPDCAGYLDLHHAVDFACA
jgi:hypothetical protein